MMIIDEFEKALGSQKNYDELSMVNCDWHGRTVLFKENWKDSTKQP